METTSYKDFLYSVEAEVAEKKKQIEKQNVSASKPVEKNSHMVAAKKAEKPSVFDQLKELPGKVDNLNKRFKLWKNQRIPAKKLAIEYLIVPQMIKIFKPTRHKENNLSIFQFISYCLINLRKQSRNFLITKT